jgi:hypothetical protein
LSGSSTSSDPEPEPDEPEPDEPEPDDPEPEPDESDPEPDEPEPDESESSLESPPPECDGSVAVVAVTTVVSVPADGVEVIEPLESEPLDPEPPEPEPLESESSESSSSDPEPDGVVFFGAPCESGMLWSVAAPTSSAVGVVMVVSGAGTVEVVEVVVVVEVDDDVDDTALGAAAAARVELPGFCHTDCVAAVPVSGNSTSRNASTAAEAVSTDAATAI